MATKSFVSIYFSPSRLQIVKLNSAGKKVDKFGSIDLPPGLVRGYGVENAKTLSEYIKKAFSNLKIREKSVGIVVPEFSSFNKSIKLPKLGQSDLDEAVRWRAQEFLPSSSVEMVMDWQIVGESTAEYEILTVAIRKDVLAGFVDAVEEAGLLPLLVVTPSLALDRVSSYVPGGKLIIYASAGEVILVVANGQNILGSTIINLAEGADVVSTASSLVRHYKSVRIEKILVGGPEFSQDLLVKLQRQLAKPVEVIKLSDSRLSAADAQKYVIPYASQLTPTEGPEEETTINLLPPKWARKYLNKKLKLQILSLLLISSLFIWGSLGTVVASYFYLESQHKSLAEDPMVLSAKQPQDLTKKVGEINKTIKKVDSILAASKNPQDVLNAIFEARPTGVFVNEYKIDLDTGKISLSGLAADRKSLVDFKDALEKNNDFSLIQIPVSSFEAETNLEYTVNFIYLPASVKKVSITPTPSK